MKLKIKAVSDKIGKDIPYPFYATAGAWICAPAWTRRWRWPPAPW